MTRVGIESHTIAAMTKISVPFIPTMLNLQGQADAVCAQLDELRRGLQLEVRRTLAQL
jgi:hypothetical protein